MSDTESLSGSWAEEARWAQRFQAYAEQQINWCPAADYSGNFVADYPLVNAYAETLHSFAHVDRRLCVVMERTWHGFPDPPQYAFFAFEGAVLWAARDFDDWPQNWTPPPAPP